MLRTMRRTMRTCSVVAAASILVVATSVGVWAGDEPLFGPATPARIEGGWVYEADLEEGELEQLGQLMYRSSGGSALFRVTSGDARFKGAATVTGDWIGSYPPALVTVTDNHWRIEDGAGTWAGSDRHLVSMADNDPLNVEEQVILDGLGAYEGLTAYVIIDFETESFVGAIIPDRMPELPDDWLEVYQAAYGDDSVGDG